MNRHANTDNKCLNTEGTPAEEIQLYIIYKYVLYISCQTISLQFLLCKLFHPHFGLDC